MLRWAYTKRRTRLIFLSPLCQIGPEQTEDDFGQGESRGRQTVVRHDWSKPGAMLEHYSQPLHTDIAAPPLWDLSPLLTSSLCQFKVHASSVGEAPAVHMCGKYGDTSWDDVHRVFLFCSICYKLVCLECCKDHNYHSLFVLVVGLLYFLVYLHMNMMYRDTGQWPCEQISYYLNSFQWWLLKFTFNYNYHYVSQYVNIYVIS